MYLGEPVHKYNRLIKIPFLASLKQSLNIGFTVYIYILYIYFHLFLLVDIIKIQEVSPIISFFPYDDCEPWTHLTDTYTKVLTIHHS